MRIYQYVVAEFWVCYDTSVGILKAITPPWCHQPFLSPQPLGQMSDINNFLKRPAQCFSGNFYKDYFSWIIAHERWTVE